MTTLANIEFGRGLYGAAEIERYVALDQSADIASQAQAWLREIVSVDDHEARRPDYSFQDLISVFVVARLHGKGVRLGRIRDAQRALKERTGARRPLSFKGLWTDGVCVFVDLGVEKQLTNLNGTGTPPNSQEASAGLIKLKLEHVSFRDAPAFADRQPESWAPASGVRVDPEIQYGTPCVDGFRISTATVASWARQGLSVAEMADEFDVPQDALERALAFERELAAASA